MNETQHLLRHLASDRVHILDRLRAGQRFFEVVADTGAPIEARLDVALMVDKYRHLGDPPMLAFDKALIDAAKQDPALFEQ